MKKGKKKKHEKRELESIVPTTEEKKVPAEKVEESDEHDSIADDIPLQYAAQAVGGKWKTRILWSLRTGKAIRYGQVKQAIAGITDMMLSNSLKELVASGLVERRQFKEIPPKVEYCLTPAGMEVVPIIRRMAEWAQKRMKDEKPEK